MSSRRLVSRQSRADPVPAPRQIVTSVLPPYEAPSFPLTQNQQLELGNLTRNHDYSKYKMHITAAMSTISNCAAESNERLSDAKAQLEKRIRQKEKAEGKGSIDLSQRSQAAEETEKKVEELEKKVDKITTDAERALRDLIDYRDEMTQWENMMSVVGEKAKQNAIEAASAVEMREAAGRSRIPERDVGSDNEDEDSEMEDDSRLSVVKAVEILSPTELLQEAKTQYQTSYTARSMYARYAVHNDYIGFKRAIHDAAHPGENVPNSKTWFPSENSGSKATVSGRRSKGRRVTTGNPEDDDDELQFAGAVSSLKCPLTLQTFIEPYSNSVCKHTFEKKAIINYFNETAAPVLVGNGRNRHAAGPPIITCPQAGCEASLGLKDFYDDQIVQRQVRRAAIAEAEDDVEDNEMGQEVSTDSEVEEIEDEDLDVKKEGENRTANKEDNDDKDDDDDDDDDMMDVSGEVWQLTAPEKH